MNDTRWSDEFLNEMRRHKDPVADRVVTELFENDSLDSVNELLSAS